MGTTTHVQEYPYMHTNFILNLLMGWNYMGVEIVTSTLCGARACGILSDSQLIFQLVPPCVTLTA